MPRSSAETRRRILDAAYGLFYARGFGRTGLDEIASAAGVAKPTFYQHFDSKDALLAAVVEHDVALSEPRISRWLQAMQADARSGLDAAFDDLARWSRSPGWMGAGFTRIVTELADLPGHPAHRIARAHKAAVEAELAGAMGSPERATELMIVLEGTMILLLIRRDPGVVEAGRRAARRIFEAGGG